MTQSWILGRESIQRTGCGGPRLNTWVCWALTRTLLPWWGDVNLREWRGCGDPGIQVSSQAPRRE